MSDPSPAEPRRDHVVVLFGSGPADQWCKLSHCPMYARGPFTRDEAEAEAAAAPAWQQPHILDLRAEP